MLNKLKYMEMSNNQFWIIAVSIQSMSQPYLLGRSTCDGTLKGQRLQSSRHQVSRPLCSWTWPVVCCPWHHRSFPAGDKWSCWSEKEQQSRLTHTDPSTLAFKTKVSPTAAAKRQGHTSVMAHQRQIKQQSWPACCRSHCCSLDELWAMPLVSFFVV